jgi:hypothetical protein
MSVTARIPFSRWGAEPFIVAPFTYPVHAAQAARSARRCLDRKRAPHPFELALNWNDELAQDKKLTKVKIAAREGLSRARVTQIMNLLDLPANIQNELRHPPEPLNIGFLVSAASG